MTDFTRSFATVEKLHNNNSGSWSTCMKFYLVGQDLWDIVSGSYVTPPPVDPSAVRKWNIKAGKAMYALSVGVEDDFSHRIKDSQSPKEAWDTLATIFAKKNDEKLQRLENELLSIFQRNMTAIEPTIADLENLLMIEEELNRPSSQYFRDEKEALFTNMTDSWGRGQDRGRSFGRSFNQEGSQSRAVQVGGAQGVTIIVTGSKDGNQGVMKVQHKKEELEEEDWDFETSLFVEEVDVVDVQGKILEEEYTLSTISVYSLDFKNDWIIDSGHSNHMTGDGVKVYMDLEITGTPVIEGRTLEVVNVMSVEEAYVDKAELSDIQKLQEHVEFKLQLDPSQDGGNQLLLEELKSPIDDKS
ncbi:hypothetical protein LIER_33402 [Lithospermum erythrorhizon]|uniref:DUF4219 domain-containing protein n=1 Tax=Lithospermum erythrorhizon TaxID=34254 RepID=A0AAV3RXJ4_LITER